VHGRGHSVARVHDRIEQQDASLIYVRAQTRVQHLRSFRLRVGVD
jgi:hypothetical protein